MKYDLGDELQYQNKKFVFLGMGRREEKDYFVVEEIGGTETIKLFVEDLLKDQATPIAPTPVKKTNPRRIPVKKVAKPVQTGEPAVAEVVTASLTKPDTKKVKVVTKKLKPGNRFYVAPKVVIAKVLPYNRTQRFRVDEKLRHHPFKLKAASRYPKRIPTTGLFQIGVVDYQPDPNEVKFVEAAKPKMVSASEPKLKNNNWYEKITKYRMEK